MTLLSAVQEVGDSIDYLQTRPREHRAGLLLDEVTVTFNVAASANAKNNGKLTLSATPTAGASVNAEAGTELTNDAERGNVIVMKFKNLATADYTKGSFVTRGTADYPGDRPQSRRADGRTTAPAEGARNKPGTPVTVEIGGGQGRADTGGGGKGVLSGELTEEERQKLFSQFMQTPEGRKALETILGRRP